MQRQTRWGDHEVAQTGTAVCWELVWRTSGEIDLPPVIFCRCENFWCRHKCSKTGCCSFHYTSMVKVHMCGSRNEKVGSSISRTTSTMGISFTDRDTDMESSIMLGVQSTKESGKTIKSMGRCIKMTFLIYFFMYVGLLVFKNLCWGNELLLESFTSLLAQFGFESVTLCLIGQINLQERTCLQRGVQGWQDDDTWLEWNPISFSFW